MSSRSSGDFETLMGSVDQLVKIHGKLQSGRGRRYEQDALHRAGVVMTVAAWQAYVQSVINEALDLMAANLTAPPGAAAVPAWAVHTFQMRRAAINTAVKKFNTPDDVRVRDLLRDSLSFDPWPSWVWQYGKRNWAVKEVRERTNTWVLVRHSVAHGFPLPSDVPWLKGSNGNPRLTLNLLKECRKHFAQLVSQTDSALALHLVSYHGLATAW